MLQLPLLVGVLGVQILFQAVVEQCGGIRRTCVRRALSCSCEVSAILLAGVAVEHRQQGGR
jgi:hypothetical protein